MTTTMMTPLATIVALLVLVLCTETQSFTPCSAKRYRKSLSTTLNASRRSFFSQALVVVGGTYAVASTAFVPLPALAIPSVTVAELEQILKDSARSIQVVEFAGPKSDIVTVRLVDGTAFGLKDIVESPTDPRSPLKLLSTLKSYKIPTKFMTIENALTTTKTRRKNYSNVRVQIAAEKEKEKAERMAQDAAEREAELYRMEEEEAKRKLAQQQQQ